MDTNHPVVIRLSFAVLSCVTYRSPCITKPSVKHSNNAFWIHITGGTYTSTTTKNHLETQLHICWINPISKIYTSDSAFNSKAKNKKQNRKANISRLFPTKFQIPHLEIKKRKLHVVWLKFTKMQRKKPDSFSENYATCWNITIFLKAKKKLNLIWRLPGWETWKNDQNLRIRYMVIMWRNLSLVLFVLPLFLVTVVFPK